MKIIALGNEYDVNCVNYYDTYNDTGEKYITATNLYSYARQVSNKKNIQLYFMYNKTLMHMYNGQRSIETTINITPNRLIYMFTTEEAKLLKLM